MFDEWMVSLRLDQRKMLAVILMETFKNRWELNAKDAATEAGSVVGFNEKTVRNYRHFLVTFPQFLEYVSAKNLFLCNIGQLCQLY